MIILFQKPIDEIDKLSVQFCVGAKLKCEHHVKRRQLKSLCITLYERMFSYNC